MEGNFTTTYYARIIISALCICTVAFYAINYIQKVMGGTNESDSNLQRSLPSNVNVMSFSYTKDYDPGEFQGKKLIQKADFVGQIKITKLKEHVDRIQKRPAPEDSIAAMNGEETIDDRYIYDVYHAEVLDSYKNPKDLKTIEIFDFRNVYGDGDYSNVEFKEGNEYVAYLGFNKVMQQYEVMSLSDGIFKVDKFSGKLKGYNRVEDLEKHKKFVMDNK